MQIGFIGLGQMGLPMAENILKRGFPLWVYNRTQGKAAPLLGLGGKWAASPAELASQCDILVSMVANDAALNEIVDGSFGVLRSSKKPSIHISMSTISPDLAASMAKKHQDVGITFLAAPVTGRPERAKEGSLWIFLAGELQAKKTVAPLLKTMSLKVFDLGEHSSQALVFKLCNNFMILSMIEAFSEAAATLEKNGIPMAQAAEIWGDSIFDSPVFHSYTPMICNQKFAEGGFELSLGLKDMRLLQKCADRAQVPMPFLSNLHEKMLACMNQGKEKYDWSVIAGLTFELAGLPVT